MRASRKVVSAPLAALAASLIVPGTGAAQEPDPIVPAEGDRVRLTLTDGERWAGDFRSLQAGRVVVRDEEGAERRIPVAEISTLEVSEGRQRRFVRTLGITVGASAVLGGALGAGTYNEANRGWFGPANRGEAFVWGAAAGAFLGTPAGVLLGVVIRPERWVEVDGGRIGLSASIPVGR